MLTIVFLAFLLAGASGAITRLLIRWSHARNILDVPNERSSHATPTPRGGGIAIVTLTVATVVVLIAAGHAPMRLLAWAAGSLAIALVSWIDDLRGVPNLMRFAVHLLGAAIAVYVFGSWQGLAGPAQVLHLGVGGVVLTLFWIVGLTNAWNFMDGIDGIAALCAAIAAMTFIAISSSPSVVATLAVPLIASTIGFLTSNWPPARIFMGDVGSAFLGYTLAVLPLIADGGRPESLWLALFAVWPFVFDTAFTFLRRLRRRENVFAAHRSHLYQRLVISGWPHARVTMLYGALSVIGGLAAVGCAQKGFVTAAICAVAAAAFGLWTLTIVVERHAESTLGGDSRSPDHV